MARHTSAVFALACLAACTTNALSGETSAADCSDKVDNDDDGLVDCDDPACSVHAWCGGSSPHSTDAGHPAPSDSGPPPDRGPLTTGCSDPIDVVFVVDVSTSMADEIFGIRSGIDSIWAATTALTSNAQFGLVVFVDDVAAVNGCAPFETVEAMQSELMRWQNFASSNAQPGGSPSANSDCPENSLDALHRAATTCPWRPGSLRILIHVTDDTFEERPAVLSGALGFGGIPVQHTYADAVDALVANEIRVGAFAAPGAGEPCGAGSSQNVGRGFHEPFWGMASLPDATGGRAWSIRDVRSGILDMAEAINEFTANEYCTLF